MHDEMNDVRKTDAPRELSATEIAAVGGGAAAPGCKIVYACDQSGCRFDLVCSW